MTTADTDRAGERGGGWGALAVASFGVLRLVALATLVGDPRSPAGAGLLLAAGAAGAGGQALAADGVRRRLGAPSRLIWTASALGWAGAALAAAGPVLIGARTLVLRDPAAAGSGLLLGWLAGFATALWAAGVCAADWRRGRLPPWLRVVGTVFAVLSLAAAVLPPIAALALPFALVWWIGLGATLLRPARSTSG